MLNFNKIENNSTHGWLFDVAAIFVIAVFLFAGAYLVFEKKYEGKIYPGVVLAGMNVGGEKPEDVKAELNKKINELNKNGVEFYYGKSKAIIMPIISSIESDLAYEVIEFNAEAAVKAAYGWGRDGNFFNDLHNKISALAFKKTFAMSVKINEERIKNILKNNFDEDNMPAEDAKLIFAKENLLGGEKNFRFSVKEEKTGKVVTYDNGLESLKKQLAVFDSSPIELTTVIGYPKIYKKDTLNTENKALKILETASLVLNYKNNKWNMEKETLAGWLALKINADAKSGGDKIIIGLDNKTVEEYLKTEVAPKIDKDPVEAKFEIKDGRVSNFQVGRDGVKLQTAESIAKIESFLIYKNKNEVELAVEIAEKNNSIGDVNDMGIKEIIGIGESNFSGSPANRRHNIGVGADTLNGMLIKPNEEFSLITALGKIDGSTGYKQELVIKQNKTIPEYGGGLCQIGTTMFRAALGTGLPITARRNHSYRVVYYEPAGTDATIYSPWPDMKFINDTGNNILIQSRIEGDNLYFDFWGTSDGRVATRTEPIIYNITRPGPTKLIETPDLAPGVKKCTERAHNGADAYFDYTVAYANGEKKEERFNSHYVPWQEVCLIGVEELSVLPEEKTAEENAGDEVNQDEEIIEQFTNLQN